MALLAVVLMKNAKEWKGNVVSVSGGDVPVAAATVMMDRLWTARRLDRDDASRSGDASICRQRLPNSSACLPVRNHPTAPNVH